MTYVFRVGFIHEQIKQGATAMWDKFAAMVVTAINQTMFFAVEFPNAVEFLRRAQSDGFRKGLAVRQRGHWHKFGPQCFGVPRDLIAFVQHIAVTNTKGRTNLTPRRNQHPQPDGGLAKKIGKTDVCYAGSLDGVQRARHVLFILLPVGVYETTPGTCANSGVPAARAEG